jgi:hypothetical protein
MDHEVRLSDLSRHERECLVLLLCQADEDDLKIKPTRGSVAVEWTIPFTHPALEFARVPRGASSAAWVEAQRESPHPQTSFLNDRVLLRGRRGDPQRDRSHSRTRSTSSSRTAAERTVQWTTKLTEEVELNVLRMRVDTSRVHSVEQLVEAVIRTRLGSESIHRAALKNYITAVTRYSPICTACFVMRIYLSNDSSTALRQFLRFCRLRNHMLPFAVVQSQKVVETSSAGAPQSHVVLRRYLELASLLPLVRSTLKGYRGSGAAKTYLAQWMRRNVGGIAFDYSGFIDLNIVTLVLNDGLSAEESRLQGCISEVLDTTTGSESRCPSSQLPSGVTATHVDPGVPDSDLREKARPSPTVIPGSPRGRAKALVRPQSSAAHDIKAAPLTLKSPRRHAFDGAEQSASPQRQVILPNGAEERLLSPAVLPHGSHVDGADGDAADLRVADIRETLHSIDEELRRRREQRLRSGCKDGGLMSPPRAVARRQDTSAPEAFGGADGAVVRASAQEELMMNQLMASLEANKKAARTSPSPRPLEVIASHPRGLKGYW